MRVLRFEMTRAFRNKWLAVSVALGTLIGLADIWLNVSQYGFNFDPDMDRDRLSVCIQQLVLRTAATDCVFSVCGVVLSGSKNRI